jgi:2-keto-4-pentenoate hydratase
MTDLSRNQETARLLLEQHRGRIDFDALPEKLAPRDVGDAYAIQEAFRGLRESQLGPVAGYKVALTSTVMQEMLRFYSPFAGPIHAGLIHQSPAQLSFGDYGRPGIECELAAYLGKDLPAGGAPYDREQIADAVESLMPAFELVDDRNADYKKIASLILTLIADNAWNGGIVLGKPVRDWQALDLAAIRGTLTMNGQVAGEGHGRDVLGHPFEALTWLTNTIASQGRSMKKGMVVMTGTMIATKFVKPGDALSFSVEGLGEVAVRIA